MQCVLFNLAMIDIFIVSCNGIGSSYHGKNVGENIVPFAKEFDRYRVTKFLWSFCLLMEVNIQGVLFNLTIIDIFIISCNGMGLSYNAKNVGKNIVSFAKQFDRYRVTKISLVLSFAFGREYRGCFI